MTDQYARDFDDLADLSSLDVGTICQALGRLIVPDHTAWAIIWLSHTDRAGRLRLERHDVPATTFRPRRAGAAALARHFGVRRVLRSGVPRTAAVPTATEVDASTPMPFTPGSGKGRTIPMRDKRGVVGALTLGLPLTDGSDITVQRLADRAGVALANARRFHAERAINDELQRLLASPPLPAARGVDLAVRLRTTVPGITVGGDWYDVSVLPDGTLAITIGDVVGHGIASAVAMTQLRASVRSLALEGLSPVAVLSQADSFLRRTGIARFVTCLHSVYQPATGDLIMANAGHLAPVHLPLGGEPELVPVGSGLPLGGASDLVGASAHSAIARRRITVRPGDALLMFTDGLVESRGRSVDQGIATLMATVARTAPLRAASRGRGRRGPSADTLCEHVVSAMQRRRHINDDDLALLVLRRRHQR